ncbi:collagen-like protein [Streptomyces sp. NPDC002795]|uniref:collagen-like protein n=1 Tax=Streptomyces sp. NPDC002795 TaxID=3364665 RepID=UPI0036CA0F1F
MSGRHAQPLLVRRWRSLMLAAILLVLSGAVVLAWLRIDAEASRADRFGAEAARRGDAVTTLAEDVRILRKQVRAEGGTPAAPDPSRAVDLPEKVGDPALVPGPRGRRGASGEPAPTLTPSPGAQGAPGVPGAPGVDSTVPGPGSTVPGPSGPPGPAGQNGTDGKDGENGAPGTTQCPDGYSWQAPADDPDALVCRRVGAAPPPKQPDPSPSDTEPLAMALDPQRRQYV